MSTSQREIYIDLEPGQAKNVPSNEFEFIYVKTAVRPVLVTVEGQSVSMEAGEKRRFVSPVERLNVTNQDQTRPLSVVLVVGVGDYEKLVVSGNITAQTGILRASGEFGADRRFPVSLAVHPQPGFLGNNYLPGEVIEMIATTDPGGSQAPAIFSGTGGGNYGSSGEILIQEGASSPVDFHRFNLKTGEVVASWAETFTGYPDLYGCYAVPIGDGEGFLWKSNTHKIMKTSTLDMSQTGLSVFIDPGFQVLQKVGCDHVNRTVWAEGHPIGESSNFRLRIYDLDSGVFIKEVEWGSRGSSSFIGYDTVKNRIFSMDASGDDHYSFAPDFTDQQALSDPRTFIISNGSPRGIGGIIDAGQLFVLRDLNSSWNIERSAVVPVAIQGKAYVDLIRQGGRGVRITRPVAYFETAATLSPVVLADGRQQWNGEVIRAVLDAYYQGAVDSALYLDHVFSIKISDTGATSGPIEKIINVDGQSFLSAEIADDFQMAVPGVVELVLDDLMPLLG